MNAKVKEWAQKLNGREYAEEVSREEKKQAAANGVIIIYGASDNILVFNGVIDEKISAIEGCEIKLTPDVSIFDPEKNKETFKYNSDQIKRFPVIKAIWCPEEISASWLITTTLPYETFDIMEDREIFCRGIVLDAEEVASGN